MILATGIDKENIFILAFPFVKNQNSGRDTSSKKQVGWKSDNGFQNIFFNRLLPDLSFRTTSEQNSMRHHYTNLTLSLIGSFNHVTDKCPVAFALRRHTSPKAIVTIRFRIISSYCFVVFVLIFHLAPFVQ